VRLLPLRAALFFGKIIGFLAYTFDVKHRFRAYSNIKMAFTSSKTPKELREITSKLFVNFGKNFIELLRMPLMNPQKFSRYVKIEGKENIASSLEKGKGVILLAMHFGSWEVASLSCAMLGFPYRMLVKPQEKYSKLDELLNSYRACGGSVILSKGMGPRDFIKSLQNNEVIGMVVDQGGRDGVLVNFLGRQATMSVGAIRMGLKLGVPICFSVIYRENGMNHRMIIDKPLELENTGDMEKDLYTNLNKIVKKMEFYIKENPHEYMWFYKIWKYSKESNIAVLNDGKPGHLRQAELIAQKLKQVLSERDIAATIQTVKISFKSKWQRRIFSLVCFLMNKIIGQGHLDVLRQFLSDESYQQVLSVKAEYVISCGSTCAGINILLSKDMGAKNISILKPSIFSPRDYNLVILPKHDIPNNYKPRKTENVLITQVACNLIDELYLENETEKLLKRFPHLKNSSRLKIAVFIGGESKNIYLPDNQIKILVNQLKEVAKEINADILLTTSRRTPESIEQILLKEFKRSDFCPFLIIANKENVPEAVGGMLGLANIVIVSGDSVSMVSEAVSSGKSMIIFPPKRRKSLFARKSKHIDFIKKLDSGGCALLTEVNQIGPNVLSLAKHKIKTNKIDDGNAIISSLRLFI